VPTREQVRRLLDSGLDYTSAGQRLGIPAGQAYLIATGRPADGGDAPPPGEARRGGLLATSQHLASPPAESPTGSGSVKEWIAGRVAADAPMREAARRRTAGPAEPAEHPTTDAVMVLTRQHNQVRALVQQLSALPSHTTGGEDDDLARRKSLVDMITVMLSQHETAEEEYLWPAVREVLPDGDERAGAALAQEQEGKDTLTTLGKLEPDTREFDSGVEQLAAQLRKHVAYEETVFLALREAMPGEDREKLGRKLLSAARAGPTRPHPHGPGSPGAAVKAAAGGAAALDTLHDAAGGRPAQRKGKPQ
jgi:hemerythrin superfamily protein